CLRVPARAPCRADRNRCAQDCPDGEPRTALDLASRSRPYSNRRPTNDEFQLCEEGRKAFAHLWWARWTSQPLRDRRNRCPLRAKTLPVGLPEARRPLGARPEPVGIPAGEP